MAQKLSLVVRPNGLLEPLDPLELAMVVPTLFRNGEAEVYTLVCEGPAQQMEIMVSLVRVNSGEGAGTCALLAQTALPLFPGTGVEIVGAADRWNRVQAWVLPAPSEVVDMTLDDDEPVAGSTALPQQPPLLPPQQAQQTQQQAPQPPGQAEAGPLPLHLMTEGGTVINEEDLKAMSDAQLEAMFGHDAPPLLSPGGSKRQRPKSSLEGTPSSLGNSPPSVPRHVAKKASLHQSPKYPMHTGRQHGLVKGQGKAAQQTAVQYMQQHPVSAAAAAVAAAAAGVAPGGAAAAVGIAAAAHRSLLRDEAEEPEASECSSLPDVLDIDWREKQRHKEEDKRQRQQHRQRQQRQAQQAAQQQGQEAQSGGQQQQRQQQQQQRQQQQQQQWQQQSPADEARRHAAAQVQCAMPAALAARLNASPADAACWQALAQADLGSSESMVAALNSLRSSQRLRGSLHFMLDFQKMPWELQQAHFRVLLSWPAAQRIEAHFLAAVAELKEAERRTLAQPT